MNNSQFKLESIYNKDNKIKILLKKDNDIIEVGILALENFNKIILPVLCRCNESCPKCKGKEEVILDLNKDDYKRSLLITSNLMDEMNISKENLVISFSAEGEITNNTKVLDLIFDFGNQINDIFKESNTKLEIQTVNPEKLLKMIDKNQIKSNINFKYLTYSDVDFKEAENQIKALEELNEKNNLNKNVTIIYNDTNSLNKLIQKFREYPDMNLTIEVKADKYEEIKNIVNGKSFINIVILDELSVNYNHLHNNHLSYSENFYKDYENERLRNSRIYNEQRKEYLTWDEYFMALSMLTSLRSKDPSTQVGACIIDDKKRILSVGYNGAPRGYDDSKFPWARTGEELHTKYLYVCHAESNAILNFAGARRELEGSTIYVDLFPCNECAKQIIQAGIKKVIYLSDKYKDLNNVIASKRLFDACGVEYVHLEIEEDKEIVLKFGKK